jgi:type IV pilus assembly protein PilQ
MKTIYFLLAMIFALNQASASEKNISLDVQHSNLSATIRLLASFLHFNVILSPAISGEVSLHVQEVRPLDAFNLLLGANGLDKRQKGGIWFVAPRDELMKQEQQEIKWQMLQDQAQPLLNSRWQLHYAKAEEISKLLADAQHSFLSPRGKLQVDIRTNSIFAEDIEKKIAAINRMIASLDVPIKHVLIEARLVSVDSDSEIELGLQFAARQTSPEPEEAASSLRQKAPGIYGLAVAKLADGALLDVKLSALEKAGHVELISSPRLFTANQQPASIEAGEEVPYQEVSESGETAVAFKKAVLSLQVNPQILPGDRVLLQLKVNQDRPSAHLVLGLPTISTRQMQTSVLVNNGATVVLGGIYENNAEQLTQKIPFLSDLPVLGLLFKQRHGRENKRQLLIFVTPTIVAS